MSKPIIFFSHSSADKDVLYKLKELFVEKTGGTIEVFLSSDGQSIPLGRNWVHRVEEALGEAKIMVVFMTPNSLRSSWIYFEAGFAYSKGIRVVPVGLLGADIAALAPPLSLLQGFNVSNKDGLDNLIALANDTFSHSHKMTFSEEEYHGVMIQGNRVFSHQYSNLSRLVKQLQIKFNDDELVCPIKECVDLAKEVFAAEKYQYRDHKKGIDGYGLNITYDFGIDLNELAILIDPFMIELTIPIVIKIIRRIKVDGIKGVSIDFEFMAGVESFAERHKLTARLYGVGVDLGEKDQLLYKGLSFSVGHYFRSKTNGVNTFLSIKPIYDSFDLKQVAELLDILKKNGVIYQIEEWIEP